MKITDLPPIFLADIQHKVLSYPSINKCVAVKLKCLKPTKHFEEGEIYWGLESKEGKTSSYSWDYVEFDAYKIFLPILGARIYSLNRFKVLDKLTIYKTDFK